MSPPAKSSTDTQEKDLMLDKDMEKDTWNFKSMTDDDPMDFGFESPAKNKKNAFKLDMGFDLAGDFGNLSSFKMDMPDFDFSSPAKKASKKKESSDDNSSGNSKQKKNSFAFSYDFDALDDFNLDSSPPKKGVKPMTGPMDCKETSAKTNTDKSDAFDFGPDLPLTRQSAYTENADVKAKASAEDEKQNFKPADAMVVDRSTHSKQVTLESIKNSEAVESPQGPRVETSRTHTMRVQPQSANTSPLKETSPLERSRPSVEEIDEPCPSNETAVPSPVHASESAHKTISRQISPDREICRSTPKEDYLKDPENNVLLPGSKTRTSPIELVNTDSEKKTANVDTSSSHEKIIHKDPSNAKTVENVSGPMDHLKLQAKNTTREKSILQINISSKLDASSLTQKLSRHLSSGAASLQKSKMASLERPKPGNIVSDLRATKPQRTIELKAAQPEVSTSVSKERNTEAPVKKSSEISHLATTPRDKTQILQFPSSLKRKALDEGADALLKPQLKRFSTSPRENRNFEEPTRRVLQGMFSSQESRMDHNTTKELVKESPQTKSHHQSINMANLEIRITENTDNIEKAEAFTKELDNICNILRKKHEEAKELLVRAVVNNNKLLMLNHPLHDEKIRLIQKFAAKLTLRGS